ncbi:hypothetical protein evm_007383 [Chilo suppressalis]|nr:hypothetical protein evm_007383 [Chilo suppressalis]
MVACSQQRSFTLPSAVCLCVPVLTTTSVSRRFKKKKRVYRATKWRTVTASYFLMRSRRRRRQPENLRIRALAVTPTPWKRSRRCNPP